jgi:Flp pilus assembly protein TadG
MFRKYQRGASAVEFALGALLFFGLILGVIESGRLAYMYASAVEATRIGARIAVVCSAGSNAVQNRMIALMPSLSTANISVVYPTAGCTTPDCRLVTVTLTNFSVSLNIPLAAISVTMPPFRTALIPEGLNSTGNNACT